MKLLLSLMTVFMLIACQAQADETLLKIQEIKTADGITAWLAEDHSLPMIALTFTFLDSGTALDPADKQGLVRLLSNTMDEGAGDLDSQNFQKELTDNSITLRFSAGRDGFGGNLKTLSRNKDKAFHLLQLALTSPRFDAEPVERMRQANMSRVLSSLSEPDWIAARILNDRIFDGHPYAMNSGGTLTTLAAITPDDLRHFQQSYLTRDRLLISVAGDISATELKATIQKIFGQLPATAPANANVADTTIQHGGEISLFEQDIPQTIISIGMPAFDRDDADYYPLKIMNYIFGEAGFGSRLMEEVREKRGLTYGIYSDIQNFRHTDVLSISTSTKNESVAELMDVTRQQMSMLGQTPVGEQELADAKSYLISSLPLALSSTDKIAGLMMGLQIEGLPRDYLDHYADALNKVTPADIQRVAARVLDPANMTIVMVGKPVDITPSQRIKDIPNAR